ncbi:MAG TPA: right-handed parallel beta-helix repeat-containing protein [Planctomycetota bacterium]|nr:right-handed parallel beta-helix repeat-containing protein [Planctomycetota bacterium]
MLLALLVSSLGGGVPVKHHVPGDFPTIQAAIDASAPGDTILVKKGVYAEAVVLSARSNLTIVGLGHPVVAPASAAPGFRVVDSSDIVIRGFDVGGAANPIVAFENGGDHRVSKCRASDLAADGIRGTNCGNTQLDGNRFTNLAGHGIALDSTCHDFRIEKNVIVKCGGTGIRAGGNNHRIEKNQVGNAGADGISTDVSGFEHDASILKNKVVQAHGVGVVIAGNDHELVGNQIVDSGGVGVLVNGPFFVAELNRVTGSGDDGFRIVAGVNDAVLEKNVVSASGGDGVDANCIHSTFEKNRVNGSASDGFRVLGVDDVFDTNSASKNGTFDLEELSAPGSNVYDANKFKKTNIPI